MKGDGFMLRHEILDYISVLCEDVRIVGASSLHYCYGLIPQLNIIDIEIDSSLTDFEEVLERIKTVKGCTLQKKELDQHKGVYTLSTMTASVKIRVTKKDHLDVGVTLNGLTTYSLNTILHSLEEECKQTQDIEAIYAYITAIIQLYGYDMLDCVDSVVEVLKETKETVNNHLYCGKKTTSFDKDCLEFEWMLACVLFGVDMSFSLQYN